MLEQDEKLLIADFIGENFRAFTEFAAERGYSEEECEKISEQILGS